MLTFVLYVFTFFLQVFSRPSRPEAPEAFSGFRASAAFIVKRLGLRARRLQPLCSCRVRKSTEKQQVGFWRSSKLIKTQWFVRKLSLCFSEIRWEREKIKLTLNQLLFSKPILIWSRGDNREFLFLEGGGVEAAWILLIYLYSPTKSSIFSKENTIFSYGCLSFLCVVFAKDIWGGAVELEEFFLIHKCLSAQQKTPACQNSVCYKNDAVSRPPNRGRPFKLNKFLFRHTHRQHRRIARAIIPAPQKFKSVCFYSISACCFSCLMEKEELKMKSIFNVYRGAQLKSLESAETILNKLIFNEKPFCARVKQSESWQRKKQTWSPFKRLQGCRTAFTSKSKSACVVRPRFVDVDQNERCFGAV